MTACVYRQFDEAGDLLYVGCSIHPASRHMQHSSKSWYDDIVRIQIERFATRREAEIAERKAIRDEMPRYNVQRYLSAPAPPLPFEPKPQQFLPAGCPYIGMSVAMRTINECIEMGVDPYSPNWKEEMAAARSADTPLDELEIDDE